MADCSKRKKLCYCLLLCFLVAGITGGAIGIYKWYRSGLNRWHGPGSTPDFQDIIEDRCYNYTQRIRPDSRSRNCQEIKQAFMSAFISKDPCKATKEDYRRLIDLADPTVPCNKRVLWSKTKELAREYAKLRGLVTLEDTLLGFLADRLHWCGEPGSPDLNTWSCPDWEKDCRTNYRSVFWEVLSERFAESACGTVQVLLNGSLENAFDEMSIFGRVEAPNLKPMVTLQVWLVHDPGKPPRDSCSGSSIKKLKSILSERNVRFICRDNLRTRLPILSNIRRLRKQPCGFFLEKRIHPGLDYQSCPTSEDCENNPVDSFWRTASIQYARDSSGVISVMLNGSEPAGAYPVKGFFADFEIPYLQKDKITQIDIWVMHEIGEPKVESCGEGSVKLLEERLDKMGFQYSCTDDYPPVKLLKCVEHSTHPDCALSSAAVSTQRAAFYAVQGACFIFPLLAAFASVARM